MPDVKLLEWLMRGTSAKTTTKTIYGDKLDDFKS
jgi:hypothetical protein